MSRMRRTLEVLPDSDRLEEALVRAAAHSPFVDGAGHLTLAQLIDRLALPALRDLRPCPPLTARIVLWSAARALEGGPFGSFVGEPAFAREALDLFSELKGARLTPADFAASVEQLPEGRRPRARALSRLYALYEAALAQAKLADRADVLRAATGVLEQGPLPSLLKGVVRVRVRDLHDLPSPRVSFLLALARRCDREGIAFELELPGAGATDIDMAVDPVLGAFEREAQELTHVEAHKTDLVADGGPLARAATCLFSSRRPTEDARIAQGMLVLCSAPSSRAEARAIARQVASHIEAGAAPEEIAVVFRELGEEAEAVAEELDLFHIPARLRRGVPLTATGAGRICLSLPLVVDEGFPAADVARILTSRYAPRVTTGCPDGVATLLTAASIRDDRLGAQEGRGAYAVRLERFAARVEARDPVSAREARALAVCCAKLLGATSGLVEEGTIAAQLDAWWRSVEALGVADALRSREVREDESTPIGRAALQALARDQAAVEALRALAQELRDALRASGAAERRMTRRTFYRWLHDAASDFNLSGAGPRTGAVRILEARELPGRSFEHLCVGGLVDGRFPGRSAPHPLFSDDDRRRINAHLKRPVFRLSTGDLDGRAPWRLAEDRLLFFTALAIARQSVSLSWARSSGGQEQLRSPFIDELIRVTGASETALPPFPVPRLDDVRTEEELRARTALETIAVAELRISRPEPAALALSTRLGQEPWFPQVQEVANIELERLRFFGDRQRPPSPFTGAITDPELQAVLAEVFRYGPERPLSASSLNRFGNCAFQGFLSDVLRLGEPEAPGEEMDARGEGTFWHKVLEVLLPELKRHNLLRRPVEEIPDELLDAALAQGVAHAEKHGHVGHPALWKLGRERARMMVARLISSEAQGLPFDGFEPAHTELRFGGREPEPGWEKVVLPGLEGEPVIHVEGTIDRVDRDPSGSVAIVDYKRSSSKLKEKFLTQDFQLALYLYAARAAGRPDAVHAAWLSMKDGEALPMEKAMDKEHSIADLLSTDPEVQARLAEAELPNLPAAVSRLVSGLRHGQFPAHAHDCDYCPYRAVCRVSERRVEEAA